MADFKISRRYATSLLENSIAKDQLEVVYRDMSSVYETIEKNPRLRHAIQNPVIKSSVKTTILTEIFSQIISADSMSFLNFVVVKGREDLLYSIVKSFLDLRDTHLGIVNVDVKTAFEFTEEQKLKLKEQLEQSINKKINFKFTITPELIGGFIAKAGDTVYDASVRHQLELLKKQFLQGGSPLN